ncbi:MAG: malonyl-ACP O-methyltransferase BioC, partial [Ectothiorhodospiraceae bacterium]
MHDDAMVPDKAETRRAFDRAADTYDAAAVLQREVGRRLVERLEIVKLQPDNVLDIGAGTGATTRELMQHYPRARFTGVDVAPRMLAKARGRAPWLRKLRCLCADAESLPLRSNSYDLIFSNLAMQWVGDLDRAFREIQRVLRPGGVLMFSSFGPDTLRELREAWSAVDGYNHVNRFIDLHDVGDAMTRARLADPVMDMEYFS